MSSRSAGRSERSIEHLSAAKEDILRNRSIMPNGSYRHSVYSSILVNGWLGIKVGLEAKIWLDG